MTIILDCETNGLLRPSIDKKTNLPKKVATKLHCLSYEDLSEGLVHSTIDLDDMRKLLTQKDLTIICHNGIRFDRPVLEKFLNIKITARMIDTLALSWYLFPNEKDHGLADWGVRLGIIKPTVEDWSDQPIEVYLHRVEEDIKINRALWDLIEEKLYTIYDDESGVNRLINYLSFKMDCAREQEENPIRLDVDLINSSLKDLYKLQEEKFKALIVAMPEKIHYTVATKPDKCYKKDGSISVAGEKWFNLLLQNNLPIAYEGEVKYESHREPGNPKSSDQLKKWLYDLGWVPTTFNMVKDKKKKTTRQVPQISNKDIDGICNSVKKLFTIEPALENLDSLTKINHRITVYEGFLRDKDENNLITADIMGLTNTLRFQHTKLVNLPAVSKPFSANIRRSLIASDENHVLIGTDMSSLEDNTKQHYMFPLDPYYVNEMRKPGFSAHLDIGVQGEMITQEESDFYIWFDAKKSGGDLVEGIYRDKVVSKFKDLTPEEQGKEFKRIGTIRKDSKQVNFSAVYGVGAPKLSFTTGWTLVKSENLLNIYWKRNWSVKAIAANCRVKHVNGEMWLFNPMSNLYYSLRYDKDRFSTLNQSSGKVYMPLKLEII